MGYFPARAARRTRACQSPPTIEKIEPQVDCLLAWCGGWSGCGGRHRGRHGTAGLHLSARRERLDARHVDGFGDALGEALRGRVDLDVHDEALAGQDVRL